ncbi:hypothetical protein FJZ31_26790 [Candidatus Poribacteria bacterium]|nr:hypothetical protein [Candidatus Poribacteria bacterium]
MEGNVFELTLEDKLYRTRFEADTENPHITVDDDICRRCEEKVCLYVCPAKVYKPKPNDSELVMVSHENCLECGTCRIACSEEGIDWRFPNGGMGVKYRYG